MVTARCSAAQCVMNDMEDGRQGGHSNTHVHVSKIVARDYRMLQGVL